MPRQAGGATDLIPSFVAEDGILRTARGLADEIGLPAVTATVGAALRMLAAAAGARTVVEIGTGLGVSGLWLLHGMRADGVLTTIDVEAEHQRMARRLFVEAGYGTGRTRIITGRAGDVLPRLADSAYDMVFVDADPTAYRAAVEAAARLLRTGGLLVLHAALAGGRHAPAIREALVDVRDSDLWLAALLPIGDGLLTAVRA